MRIKALICALAMVAPMACLAQFDFGGGETGPAWASFKLNPKTKVKLGFQNTSVDMIVSWYSKTSGVTIIKDPSLTGALTVTSAKPVTLNEAFSILNTVLGLKNFELSKESTYLVIRARQQRQQNNTPTFDPSTIDTIMKAGQPVLKVYTIQFANASAVAKVVNDVFAASPNPFDQFQQMLQGMGGGGGGGFPQRGGGGNNGGGGGRGGRGGGGGGNPFNFGGGGGGQGRFGRFGGGGFGQTQSQVRASSDDFSNSVIVNAPASQQQQVEDLIRKIDRQTSSPQQSKVFKLQFASSDQLAPVVQNVLTQNAPTGRGGIGTQNVPIEQRFQQAFRLGSSQASFGTVVSEPRTNSIVVTATDDNLKIVEQVIKELDTEVKIENTTFVFPLANARADQIANLMQQTFGTRQGLNNRATTTVQNNRNNNTTNTNRNNTNTGRPPTLGAEQTDPSNLDLETNPDGSLKTDVMVQQGGFFGGGGQRANAQNSLSSATQTGRNTDGRLVNIRDLQNQITVIPDMNTNSVIVVGTPDNVEMIKQILAQLDQIPQQVMIETKIIEATLDASSQFGLEWKYAQSNPLGPHTGTSSGGPDFGLQNPPNSGAALQGFRYTLTGGALSGFINMLQTDTKFQVLSTPRIFTSNNVQAEINVSQSVPYILSTRDDGNGGTTFNYGFLDVGIILTVTPHIAANGMVTMDVTQTANDLQGYTDFNAPIVNQREADTTVSVKDGDTIILGGIIRQNVTSTVKKIPLIGDIPILGNLFRSTSKDRNKTELLVFLTPRIVRDPEEARKLRDDEFKKLSKPTQNILKDDEKKSYDPDQDKKHTVPPPDTTGKGGGK